MRAQVLAYLSANLSGSIKTSSELPFDSGGQALYLKNLRKVYLAEEFTETDQLIAVLDTEGIMQQITTVQAFLAVDAKARNTDLDSALTVLASARTQSNISDSFRKEFSYSTTIEDDVLVYQFEYKFYTIV